MENPTLEKSGAKRFRMVSADAINHLPRFLCQLFGDHFQGILGVPVHALGEAPDDLIHLFLQFSLDSFLILVLPALE